MGRPDKYITDEESYKTSNEFHLAYGKKPWKCESCDIEITYNAKVKHLKSKKHLKSDFKPWKCDICNVTIHENNRVHHLQTEKHKRTECPTCSDSESDSEECKKQECPTCRDSK